MKKAFFTLLILLPVLSFAQLHGRARLDSLLKERSSPAYDQLSDTGRVKLILEISSEYRVYDTDSTGYFARQGLDLSKKINYRYGIALSQRNMGLADYYNFNVALDYCHRSLRIFEELGDDRMIGQTLGVIGGIYFNIENYPEALNYFKKGLEHFEKISDQADIADAHNSIAATYINFDDFKSSLAHEQIALRYYEQTRQLEKMAKAYSNLGIIYTEFKQYNIALGYSAKAIGLFRSFGRNDRQFAYMLSEAGYLYYLIGIDSTTVLQPDSLLPADRPACLDRAVAYYNESLHIAQIAGVLPVETTKRLSDAYEAMGRHDKALLLYKQYVVLRDSALTHDDRLGIATLETRREEELKEKQIEINRILKVNQRLELVFFGVIACLLCVVIALGWKSYKKQRKANAVLGEEKAKLELANTDLAIEKERSDELTSDLRESLLQKDALAAQLSLAADMKTRFLANISHELRTPVTLLTGMLELMKGRNVNTATPDNKNTERLEIAYNNSLKLQYMVEEILDLSRPGVGETTLNLETKEIAPVLKRMVYAFESFMEKQQLKLSFTGHNVDGIHISVDERMLERIVNNLVYNAIKFNERGGSVKVNLLASGDRSQLIFTINNTGSIISPDDMPYIFDRFYQGNTSAARAEGAGIGLSLVKEFAALMNGTVDVTSREGAGTTFTLKFPVVDHKPADILLPQEAAELLPQAWEYFPRRQTVLVVEDNDEMRFYLKEVLGENVDLAEAVNGKEALQWLAGNRADMIISDMMMPEMGGEEFVSNLKNNEAYKNIPVITLTALADAGTKLDMFRLGIDDYIVKPFNAIELRVRVYNLLHNLEERRKFEAKPVEQDDIALDNTEAEQFRTRVTEFVLARMKTIDVSVYDLAYELSMSERQLYRLAKKLTGCTPAQLIKEVRLLKAYELLISGTVYKVDDVSKQVGFEDSNYFSRQFFERFGKRPSEFL